MPFLQNKIQKFGFDLNLYFSKFVNNNTLVKPIVLGIGAIPAVIAILIAVPLLTQPEIPYSAANAFDKIDLEYTKHQLKKVSFGVAERVAAQKSEILSIKNDGTVRYTLTEDGSPQPDKHSEIDEDKLLRITAMIKETGFTSIPSESFEVRENVDEYQKSTIKITLNGKTSQIHWPEQNATEKFVPPIITMVEAELDQIIKDLD